MVRRKVACNSFASAVPLLMAVAFLVSGQSKSPTDSGRSLFLNGVDISSARNQIVKNVTVRIDEDGNVFIEAPQYNVREESEYLPITKWAQGAGKPNHAAAPQRLPVAPPAMDTESNNAEQSMPKSRPLPGENSQTSIESQAPRTSDKAGTKMADPSSERPALSGEVPAGP